MHFDLAAAQLLDLDQCFGPRSEHCAHNVVGHLQLYVSVFGETLGNDRGGKIIGASNIRQRIGAVDNVCRFGLLAKYINEHAAGIAPDGLEMKDMRWIDRQND